MDVLVAALNFPPSAVNTAQAPSWLPRQLVPFVTLSVPTAPPVKPDSFPDSSYYGAGLLDFCLMITFIAVMAVLRDATRLLLAEPFARWKLTRNLRAHKLAKLAAAKTNGKANGTPEKANGHGAQNGNGNGYNASSPDTVTPAERKKLRHAVTRFSEQGWPVVYYAIQVPFGMYVHANLPTSMLNPVDVWANYPHFPLAGPVKFYYLLQTAFYIHQVLILNAEARRKDHWQMMSHHVITIALMVGSYFYNYTRVGCLIMLLMDICDIFLPSAKMLKYLGMRTLCDVMFITFMVSWFITRHVLFNIVIKVTWEVWYIVPRIWDPSRGHYLTKEIYLGFFTMLCTLQVIQLVWFGMICRVAYLVVSGKGAEDTRSDDEE
ncbi:longevity assurance proteins LAG1/LAC1 [Epithele typhae]|uniref:longevity assurance proteins LAG1/LAC1 n=1 Tax=Epithele typhae TaxID=378194 RepID=UPI00200885C6|nr:longevity assurance proteins LAG1/LAC1 [Epithele typhae]KAH9912609.1 longevity assurance proteins LAG1/LAC1 [Epithele typhae]